MKKVLFVINNLNCGGAEKALISLLETIDYSKYEVDLYIFKHEGIFMSKIPKEVNLLAEPEYYKYFDMSIKKALIELLGKGKVKIAISRLLVPLAFKNTPNKAVAEQKLWKYLSNALPTFNKQYDVAIGYLEKTPTYFIVDKVDSMKKIGWIHNDYEQLGMSSKIDEKYFKDLDYIFTVSEKCLEVLKRNFPQYSSKFKLMNNIVSPKTIKKLADEEVSDIEFDNNIFNIVSVGRLEYQKGYDLSIKACEILLKKGYHIRWIVIGEGKERNKLENEINILHLEEHFKLIGIRENPYKYIKRSDLYVQASRFEGKSIAIDEAKILEKPIVITNFSTASDQIVNNMNGLISEIDSYDLAEKIECIIKDINIANKFISNLKSESLGNESEIDKLYKAMY